MLLRRCVTAGWVDFHGGQRPVVVVTVEGQDVIHQRRPARLLLPPVKAARVKATPSHTSGKQPPAVDVELDAEGRNLFEALRAWRVETARGEKVPPYVIASDRTLREIAAIRPTNDHDLAAAHGIGSAKVAKYGEAIVGLVQSNSA